MAESNFNRLGNCGNRFQGGRNRVLCVCSAGMLRSPTIAWVLSNEPYGFNTRAAGISDEYALIPVDEVLLSWADEIVCVAAKEEVLMKVFAGRVYAYHANGSRKEREIVRVIGDGMYVRFKGPRKVDTPYNYGIHAHFRRATRQEIQLFVEKMP
jgi:predicted protein tyrosine phosphatase